MKFSVIIPTFNRRRPLGQCLAAIFANSLSAASPSSQTNVRPRPHLWPDFEVLVVDDGSSDGTTTYLSSLSPGNFRWFSQRHRGPAAARNLAAQKSPADFLAFTDDDCLVPPDWLPRLGQGFAKYPRAAAVGGYLEAPGQVLAQNPLAQLEAFETHEVYHAGDQEYAGGFESPAGGTNNIAYRRDVFEKLGGFDETFPVPAGEDADLKLRAVRAGYQIVYLPLKVTHLDPYSLKSFLRRSIRAGLGSAHFEKKHYGQKDSAAKLLIRFLRSGAPLLFLGLISFGRGPVAFLRRFKEILMLLGRWQYLRDL